MRAHREETDASRAKAEDTARILLENADLPLVIRACACMILGCSDTAPDYLHWAEEGVRVAELGVANTSVVGEVERRLLANCKKIRDEAKKASEDDDALQEVEQEGDTVDGDDIKVASYASREGRQAAYNGRVLR